MKGSGYDMLRKAGERKGGGGNLRKPQRDPSSLRDVEVREGRAVAPSNDGLFDAERGRLPGRVDLPLSSIRSRLTNFRF